MRSCAVGTAFKPQGHAAAGQFAEVVAPEAAGAQSGLTVEASRRRGQHQAIQHHNAAGPACGLAETVRRLDAALDAV